MQSPAPTMPLVESPEPGVRRWTFANPDPAARRAAFNYWRGWFGLDENDEPEDASAEVWLVRATGGR